MSNVRGPVAGLLAVVLVACGSTASTSAVEGEFNRFEPAVGGQPWMVHLTVDETELGGIPSVSVYFDLDELRCDDGGSIEPDELEPGQRIAFVIDDDIPTPELPATVGGRQLRADCD